MIAEKPLSRDQEINHAAVVGSVQVGQDVVGTRLLQDDRMAPHGMAVRVELLDLHIAVTVHATTTSPPLVPAIFGGKLVAAAVGELHASLAPLAYSGRAHLGGGHPLVHIFPRGEKGQQQVARGIGVSVVLSGAVAEIGDHRATVRKPLQTSRA